MHACMHRHAMPCHATRCSFRKVMADVTTVLGTYSNANKSIRIFSKLADPSSSEMHGILLLAISTSCLDMLIISHAVILKSNAMAVR